MGVSDVELYAKCVHMSNVARGKAHINDHYEIVVDKSTKIDNSTALIQGHLAYN